MNIRPEFKQGIKLKPGPYDLEIVPPPDFLSLLSDSERKFYAKKIKYRAVITNQDVSTNVIFKEIKNYNNGDKYVGIEINNKIHHGKYNFGKGKWEGDIFIGGWEDGRKTQGTYTWSDGGKYVGEFKNGKKHGQGTFTSPDGYSYTGRWNEGKISWSRDYNFT